MSCFTVEILPPISRLIDIETCTGSEISSTTIQNFSAPNIEINQCVAQLPSNFSDIVLSVTSGIYSYLGHKHYSSDILDLQNYRNVNSSSHLVFSDNIIFADCSTSDITISLPTASGLGGKKFYIKRKDGSFGLTIMPSGSEKIDGGNLFNIHHNFQSITLTSDNTNWYII